MVLAGGALLILLAVGAAARLTRGDLWSVKWLDDGRGGIAAFDRSGRELWRHTLDGIPFVAESAQSLVTDLDGDGHSDAAISVDAIGPDGATSGRLLAFDRSGRQLWQYLPVDQLRFARETFGVPWEPNNVFTYRADGRANIAWVIHHHTWWPGVLVLIDGSGHRVGEFVNAGWLFSVRQTVDEKFVLVSGVSNSRNAAILAILESKNVQGSSPEDEGSEYKCESCPPGRPFAYFTMSWTDVADAAPPFDRIPTVMVYPSGNFELRAQQVSAPASAPEAILEISPSLHIVRRTVSDSFWTWHERFEKEGRLTHTRENCPIRNGPAVRAWTPASGWREVS
jgi:hypothetical protein